jgi:hypothetical protein
MDEDMLTMTSVLLQILDTTDPTPNATFRSFTTLAPRSPGSSENVSPAEAETVNVQPAGEVPVTHMGHPQDAHDKNTEKQDG